MKAAVAEDAVLIQNAFPTSEEQKCNTSEP
jgi:hypothetical protein